MSANIKEVAYRIEPQHYFNGRACEQKYVIKMKHRGRWWPLGTSKDGVLKFDSKEDAEAHLAKPIPMEAAP